MNHLHLPWFGRLLLSVMIYSPLAACSSREASVRPGVNKEFEGDLRVEDWVAKFEGESREIFQHREAIVSALQLRPGMAVADIGAGTGFFTMMFANKVGPDGLVYAVDIADEFVAHIDAEAKRRDLVNVRPVLCKADSVELPPASVDIAFICDTYHHFEFPKSTMRSLHKALRSRGALYVIDFKREEGKSRDWVLRHVRAGEEEFTREIESAGFRRVPLANDAGFLKENYMIRFERL